MPTVAAHGQRQELKWILRSRRVERGVRAVSEGRRASCIRLQLTDATSRASPELGLLLSHRRCSVLARLAVIIEHGRLIVLDEFAHDVREHDFSYILKRAAQRWQVELRADNRFLPPQHFDFLVKCRWKDQSSMHNNTCNNMHGPL